MEEPKEICRDFKRGHCPRGNDCPFIHKKKKDASVEICRDYTIRGHCPRKGLCPYRHPKNLPKSVEIYSAQTHSFGTGNTAPALFCHDYLVGRCTKGNKCVHLHSSDRVEVCRNYLRGSCTKDDCELHHPYTVDKIGEICRDYQTEVGCLRGEKCPFVHVAGSVEICRDFLKGECTRTQCSFHHPLSSSTASTSGGSDSGNKRKRRFDGGNSSSSSTNNINNNNNNNSDSSDVHRLREEIKLLREQNKILRQENNSLRIENNSLKRIPDTF